VKSITEKQNELVMKNCQQMQKLTELENVTKEVKTITETRKDDQILHVHVRQTSDDKDEINSNEYFPIIRENTNSVLVSVIVFTSFVTFSSSVSFCIC
jgi:hypothetical protein